VSDVLPPRNPGQNVVLVSVQLGRDEPIYGSPYNFFGAIAEDPLGGRIPGQNGALQVLTDDRIVGGFDYGGEPRCRKLSGVYRSKRMGLR